MIKAPKGMGVFAWKRLILTVTVLLVINGVLAWFTTPQEEDPQLAPRDGIVTVVFPGATPKDMEHLIAKPVEDELAQVDAVKTVTTKLRTDFMFMQIKLRDTISSETETQAAWDKVQDALDRAGKKLPETAWKPELSKEIYDQDAVLLALSGTTDRLVLLDQARALKDRLQSIPSVKKIDQVAAPGEQLSVAFEHGKLTQHGVSLESLVRQLRGGNASIPSGYVRVGEKKVSVVTNSFYRSPDELARFPVILKSGDTIPLSEIAKISRTPSIPVSESMRHDGAPAMALGVVAQHNVNLQRFGEQVREAVAEFKATPEFQRAGLKIDEVSFQPHYVEERIKDIGLDLVKAIFLVGGVLMLMLGVRVGSIVAIQVPVVTAIAFGIFSYRGGVLNQISIAAFILAIGLLVDNVVVVVDGIQEKLDRGLSSLEAGEQTRKEYLVPLAAGTLTTVAAFMPILMAKGTVSDFTRAIGIVATIALLSSYAFCILVTPIVASGLLRKGKARQWHFVTPLGARLGSLVNRFPRLIVLVAVCLVVTAAMGFGLVKKQFFPFADRDLVIVDLQLPEGTHYKTTEAAAIRVESELRKDPRVLSVTTLVGRGVPPFYYNLPREPNAPHIAQLIVRAKSTADAKRLKADQEAKLQELVPFGTLMVKEIAQGPVIRAPIEVRVYSHDPRKLEEAAQKALAAVRSAGGVWKVRSTLGVGMMTYRLDVNDSAAGNYGITRAETSSVILASTRGIPVTTYRGGSDPYAISLTSKKGEESALEDVQSGYLANTRTESLAVRTLTSPNVEFTPAVLEHRDRVPVVYILGEIAPGSSENVATRNVTEKLAKLPPVEGARIQMGGANVESADANQAIFLALPVGLFLLLLSLMFEFNSFRRVGIILTTIPLCAVGAVPGLILSGSTFGFMTLLGFFTLAGTVIHNGIFLIDYIDHRVHDGVPIDVAITEGIQRRTRPIILTAVATIVELLPMTMSASTLWPPFAWAIISGLSVSTLMTLLVIPSIYKLAFEKAVAPMRLHPEAAFAALALVVGLTVPTVARAAETPTAREISLAEVLERAKAGPDSLVAKAEAEKAEGQASALWRATYLPKLGGFGSYSRLTKQVGVVNPLAGAELPPGLPIPTGNIYPSNRDSLFGRVELTQSLVDVSHMLYAAPAASRLAEAAKLKASHDVKEIQRKGLAYYLQSVGLRAKREALEEYAKNLKTRRNEIQRLYELGGVSEADLLKVKLGIEDANQGIREIEEKEDFLATMLAQALGERGKLKAKDLPDEIPQVAVPASKGPEGREDIQALDKQIESAELQAKAARAFALPQVEAFAGYTYFRNDFLTENNWGDFGVRVRWPIFDGAVGLARASAASAERDGLERRKQSAVLAIEAETTSARRSLEIRRQEYLERVQAVADAKRASELDFQRLRRGKVTVNNVIDAEDMLKDRREKAATSKVNWYQEWFRYQSAIDSELSVPGRS